MSSLDFLETSSPGCIEHLSFAQILSPTNLLLSRSQFEQLGSLIASRPRIKDASRFLFIPGPGDPGFYQLLL
jgi:hypothetical protein